MTRLSIATLITTLVLLTGCDAADMAYNIFTTEEYELLCQAESGEGIKKVSIRERKGVGEVIAPHYEVVVNKETIVIIYKPL